MSDNIRIKPEQIALLKPYVRRIEGLVATYARVASQLGDLRDRIKAVEEQEHEARSVLKQAETEYTTILNEVATELGYTPGQSWRYNQNDFSFTVQTPNSDSGAKEMPS